MSLPRIVLTAPSSGSGKTLVTCGILQALVNRGLKVSSFKCGPDYIDPMFHSRVIGTPSKNLDPFFTDTDGLRYLFSRSAAGRDISVIEGVMGFYDGIRMDTAEGSTFEVSAKLDSPVILTVNAAGASLSAVPVVKGFREFRENNIRGVIFNNMSAPVFEKISKIMKEESDVEVIGYVPKVKDLVLESRHLGLCLPSEIDDLKSKLMRLAEIFEETLNLDLLLKIAGEAPDIPFAEPAIPETGVHAKIALADDETFCFTYEDNIELLERCGAEFVRFSPMNDAELPPGVSGMILSGGYPELHAKILSENVSMRESVRKAIEAGMPCIAECGGFMYLHKEMEGSDGSKYPMAGAVDSKAENKNRLSRFGYITVKGTEGSVIGDREIKAHEFHYWDSDDFGCDCKATKASNGKEYQCMFCRDNMVAGYPHLYLYSNPEVASEFVARCSEFGKNRSG